MFLNYFLMKKKKDLPKRIRKIKQGDLVRVLLGKDKGREGKVIRVLRKKGLVLVEGINKVKKHVKARSEKEPGGIVETEKPLWLSKVALICPRCKKPTRVGFSVAKTGEKQRLCRKCQGLIDLKKTK